MWPMLKYSVVLLGAGASAEWVRTDKDSRLPVELRLANEGLAHGRCIGRILITARFNVYVLS